VKVLLASSGDSKGVLDELKAKAPVIPSTERRKRHLHRLLTPEDGRPHLEEQIVSVTTLLRISDTSREFTSHFSKAFPPAPDDLFALPPPTK